MYKAYVVGQTYQFKKSLFHSFTLTNKISKITGLKCAGKGTAQRLSSSEQSPQEIFVYIWSIVRGKSPNSDNSNRLHHHQPPQD